MKKWMKFGGRVVAGALLCGSMMFGTAAAEQAPAMDGMEAFREAISMTTKQDRRVFRQDLLFFAPSVRADLDLIGQTLAHKLRRKPQSAGHRRPGEHRGPQNPLLHRSAEKIHDAVFQARQEMV